MNANTLSDGSMLRVLGVTLEREERAAPVVRCAWCDREAGIQPDPALNQSHGICPKHHAGVKAHLDELRRMAA